MKVGETNMKFINLTPHDITIVNENGEVVKTITASGTIARLKTETITTGYLDDIPVTKTVFGKVENLPSPQENTVFIVSSLIAQAVPERTDIFIPNESVRNDKGRIVGCRSLGKI